MNRSTLVALAGFVVLLAVVLGIKYWPKSQEERVLTVEGWKLPESGERKASADGGPDAGSSSEIPATPLAALGGADSDEEPAPIDRIEIIRKGVTIVVERSADDPKEWNITKPLQARADWFRLRRILQLFEKTLTSSLAKSVQPEDLRVFKLDEAHRITLRLSYQGKTFADLVIGGTEKSEQAAGGGFPRTTNDTWVFRNGDTSRAFRMPGVDLRAPVDHDIGDLRSKSVFNQKKETVNRVIVENPDDTQYPRIVIVHEPEQPPAEDGGTPTPASWRFETPKGFRVGNVPSYLSTILSLRAKDYLPADDAAGTAALAENAARVTLETEEGSIVLHVSAPVENDGYVRVEGRDEIIKVAKYSIKGLRKTLSELRDKKVFTFGQDAITRVHLINAEGELELRLVDGVWTAVQPAGLDLAKKRMDRLTRDVAGLTVTDFVGNVPPSESGLDAPTRRLTVEAAGGVHALLLGAEVDNKVYGTIEGSGEVFRVASYTARKLDTKADDLRDKKIFPLERADIVRLDLVFPDLPAPVVLVRGDGDAWKMETPQALPEVKKPTMTTMLSTLAALEARSFAPDKRAAEVGLEGTAFHVVVHAADGVQYTLWVSEEKDGTAVYARTDVPKWAGQVFTINEYQGNNLKKRPADLKP